jgi:L-threonylcarbamoyladenylate synthase
MTLEEEIKYSAELLRKGKIILYPTDTIWGIGCDATNAKAVQKIYKLKQRDSKKSMIVLLDTPDKLEKYVKKVPPYAYDLIENSASPLTIVYPGARNMAKNLIPKDGTIAIRIVRGRYSGAVIKELDKPLVSTSANISGQPTASTFDQISEELKSGVDYIVEHFREQTKTIKPSTVIKLKEDGRFTILRQ